MIMKNYHKLRKEPREAVKVDKCRDFKGTDLDDGWKGTENGSRLPYNKVLRIRVILNEVTSRNLKESLVNLKPLQIQPEIARTTLSAGEKRKGRKGGWRGKGGEGRGRGKENASCFRY